MRARTIIALAILSVGTNVKSDQTQEEMKKILGTWTLRAAEVSGKKLDDQAVKKSKAAFFVNGYELILPYESKEPIKGKITRLDPTNTPKEMDFVRSSGPNAGNTIRAIYELAGKDQFKVCFDPSGRERPREFRTAAGTGHVLHIWRRPVK